MAPTLCEGRYRVLNVLGEGGMSTVYAAHDERLGVQRAVKILSPALTHHASLRKRFEAEARTTARLRHPHIVTVHDVGTDQGRTFMVLELMPGGSLMSRVEACGPMPPRMACEIVISILSALQYAHEKGVIHRDVKPHNILVDSDGVPKLTDFGIARLLNSDQGLTRTGAAIGTPAYMAPEQRGNASQVDGRADVFSAGATLYTLLTGREPFDIYAAELQERLFADIPAELHAVLRRATRYAVEDRYATGAAMLNDLREAMQHLPPDPEDTLPLGSPLPGRIDPPRAPNTLTPESRSQFTFDDPEDIPEGMTPPPPSLAAFPSLSGVERPRAAAGGTDIEHSLNTKGDEPRPGLFRPMLWLGMAALLTAATVAGILLWRAENPAPTGAGPVEIPVSTPRAIGAAGIGDPAAGSSATTSVSGAEEPGGAESGTGSASTGSGSSSAPTSSGGSAETGSSRTSKTPVTNGAKTATTPSTPSSPTATAPSGAEARPTGAGPNGTLSITSKPRADVFVEGSFQGRTRWREEMAPGKWKVILESEEGGRHEVELTVLPDQETRYCWDFKLAETCAR